jgi:hypothetical protein
MPVSSTGTTKQGCPPFSSVITGLDPVICPRLERRRRLVKP